MNQSKYYIGILQVIVVIALIIGLTYNTVNGLNTCQSRCIASVMINK